MEKINLEPGMYQTQLLGAVLYTDNKEVADFINERIDRFLPQDEFDKAFPGLIKATVLARKELEMERFAVEQLLHRRGRVQASAGPTYMCMASNWIPVE